MGEPYTYKNRKYEYYYDNDDGDYLLDEDITYVRKSTPPQDNKGKDASAALEKLEKLKREALIGKLSHEEFMDTQIRIFNEFNSKWDEFLLDTEYAEDFYSNLNLYFENKGE